MAAAPLHLQGKPKAVRVYDRPILFTGSHLDGRGWVTIGLHGPHHGPDFPPELSATWGGWYGLTAEGAPAHTPSPFDLLNDHPYRTKHKPALQGHRHQGWKVPEAFRTSCGTRELPAGASSRALRTSPEGRLHRDRFGLRPQANSSLRRLRQMPVAPDTPSRAPASSPRPNRHTFQNLVELDQETWRTRAKRQYIGLIWGAVSLSHHVLWQQQRAQRTGRVRAPTFALVVQKEHRHGGRPRNYRC